MRHTSLSLLAGALLAAVAAAPAQAAPGDLGNDMAGQACRLTANAISCGTAGVVAGGLHQVALGATLPAGDAARRGAVAAAIRGLPADGSAAGLRC
ncbi:MAG TPA: hypothetical protein VNN98_04950, partial [Rhizomicrobium sp.]|nr:hypothetical protein [Rhizomicrobium sp.]